MLYSIQMRSVLFLVSIQVGIFEVLKATFALAGTSVLFKFQVYISGILLLPCFSIMSAWIFLSFTGKGVLFSQFSVLQWFGCKVNLPKVLGSEIVMRTGISC